MSLHPAKHVPTPPGGSLGASAKENPSKTGKRATAGEYKKYQKIKPPRMSFERVLCTPKAKKYFVLYIFLPWGNFRLAVVVVVAAQLLRSKALAQAMHHRIKFVPQKICGSMMFSGCALGYSRGFQVLTHRRKLDQPAKCSRRSGSFGL